MRNHCLVNLTQGYHSKHQFMRTRNKLGFILTLLLLIVLPIEPTLAQQDDVVRINAELVQTGVTVFDKQGRLVDGLKIDDFELRVDGRVVPISFFENIVAGSLRDRVARVRGNEPAADKSAPLKNPADVSYRQRTIVFFLDDRHLSLGSLGRTRKTLSDFINKEMGSNDLVAIASASGQIGFLQQFTDNKDVLRAAIERINHVPYVVTDYGGNPGSPMTENMALSIERKDDSNVSEFFVQDCLRNAPRGVTRQERASLRRHCEVEVQNRARQIVLQAGTVTYNTYYSLETLLRSAERMPGSKLAFFFSDGFLADSGPRGPIAGNQLGRITDQARRAGVVIYTIDARGLVSGALDATGNVPLDPEGKLESANAREIAASQDALNALAVDTGGRALRNQNSFDQFVNEAVAETSRYYLIAWRPEASEEKTENFKKIQISVIGRPELTVRAARNYVSNRAAAAAAAAKTAPTPEEKSGKPEPKADTDLRTALNDSHATQALPLQLALIYLDTPANGVVLTTSVQALTSYLSYGDEQRDPAQLAVAGVVLNDQGKRVAAFKTELKVNPTSLSDGSANVIYNYRSALKPGIYQVRVAARDARSGLVGSAMDWVVVPDLSARQLSLSSLIVGLESVTQGNTEAGQIQWSVDKRFALNSQFEFMTFIYNSGANNLVARVQVYKDGRSVMSLPPRNVEPDRSDPQRVPFRARINLAGLPAGRYLLEVVVQDRNSQKSASQQTTFYIREP
jgi:VWFA-related protein